MKNKKIILLILLALYFMVCGLSYLQNKNMFKDIYTLESMKSRAKKNGYNYTTSLNAKILKGVYDYTNPHNHNKHSQYIYLFDAFDLYHHDIIYYVTNTDDVEKLIEKEDLKNIKNIDYMKVKFNLPIADKSYANLFKDYYATEKRQAKITGKDENGYSKFDISPDSLILLTYNKEILAYGYIDNRLIDTRDIMNKKYYRNQYNVYPKHSKVKELTIVRNDENSYNKFKLEESDV